MPLLTVMIRLIKFVRISPNVVAVEMEAAAIAQVCHGFNLPFVIVRAVSDVADKESHLSFEEFLPLAAEKSSTI